MIYFPKSKTKLLLYSLCGLLFLNSLFLSTKSYSINDIEIKLKNISDAQYQEILSSTFRMNVKIDYIKSTEINYLYIFPESSILIIYFGYFLIAILFIKYLKISADETTI